MKLYWVGISKPIANTSILVVHLRTSYLKAKEILSSNLISCLPNSPQNLNPLVWTASVSLQFPNPHTWENKN